MRKTIIIAEIGENHFGQWDICRGMVEEVAANKADYAKFQTYTADEFGKDHPWYDEFKRVQMPTSVHFEMQQLCRKKGVGFLSSAFTKGSTSFLVDEMGLTEIKLASSRIADIELLDYVNSRSDQLKTVFLSTGMTTLNEIRTAVKHLAGIEKVYLLHCTSQYPTDDKNVNLRGIITLKKEFSDFPIGFSDHSRGIEACLAAVAMGAEVLEKHFTYHTRLPGDDHAGALTPESLSQLCHSVERIDNMLGSGEKIPVPAEEKAKNALKIKLREIEYR